MSTSQRPSLNTVFNFITMLAVVIGVVYGGVQLRQIRLEQERQAVVELHRIVQTPEFIRALDWVMNDFPDHLDPSEYATKLTPQQRSMRLHISMTWESIGIMVYRRDLPLEWADEFYRGAILISWEKLERLVRYQRAETGYSGRAEWFQWLVERLRERQGGAEPTPAYEAYRGWKE